MGPKPYSNSPRFAPWETRTSIPLHRKTGKTVMAESFFFFFLFGEAEGRKYFFFFAKCIKVLFWRVNFIKHAAARVMTVTRCSWTFFFDSFYMIIWTVSMEFSKYFCFCHHQTWFSFLCLDAHRLLHLGDVTIDCIRFAFLSILEISRFLLVGKVPWRSRLFLNHLELPMCMFDHVKIYCSSNNFATCLWQRVRLHVSKEWNFVLTRWSTLCMTSSFLTCEYCTCARFTSSWRITQELGFHHQDLVFPVCMRSTLFTLITSTLLIDVKLLYCPSLRVAII